MGVQVRVGADALAALEAAPSQFDVDRSERFGPGPHAAETASALPSPGWLFDAWCRWEPGITPVAVVVPSDREPGGDIVVPLGIRRRFGFVELVAAGHPVVDLVRWAGAARTPDAVASGIVRALHTAGPRASLRLEQVAADEAWIPALAAALGRRPTPGQSVAATRLGDDRDPTLVAGRNFRRKARQVERRIVADGHALEVASIVDLGELVAALRSVDGLRSERDSAAGRRTPFDGGPGSGALRTSIRSAAQRGELELVTVSVDGELVAYNLTVTEASVVRVIDGRVSPHWRATALGVVADLAVVTSACAVPTIEWIDWGRGVNSNKARLATDIVETVDINGWNSPIAGVLGPGLRAARRRAQHGLAEHPHLQDAWRQAKRRIPRPGTRGSDSS